MARTKKIKYKQADGTLSDYIAIGADAKNIDLEEGITLEDLNKQLVRTEDNILTNFEGNIIYPETKVENITNSENVALKDTLNDLEARAFRKANESGTEIKVDYAMNTISTLQIKGNTAQDVTLGKNYFNPYAKNQYPDKTTKVVFDDRIKVTHNSGAANGYAAMIIPNYKELLGKTVTLSVQQISRSAANLPRIALYHYTMEGGPVTSYGYLDEAGSTTFTFPDTLNSTDGRIALLLYSNWNGTAVVGDYIEYTGVQLEIGGTATNYVPYKTKPAPEYESKIQSIKSKSDNIFNFETSTKDMSYTWAEGDDYEATGAIRSEYIPIGNITSLASNYKFNITFHDINKVYLGNGPELIKAYQHAVYKMEFPVDSRIAYFRITYKPKSHYPENPEDMTAVTDIMLNTGLDVLPYQPFGYVPVKVIVEGKNYFNNNLIKEEGITTKVKNGFSMTRTSDVRMGNIWKFNLPAGTYKAMGIVDTNITSNEDFGFWIKYKNQSEQYISYATLFRANGWTFTDELESLQPYFQLSVAAGKYFKVEDFMIVKAEEQNYFYTNGGIQTIELPLGDIELNGFLSNDEGDYFTKQDGKWHLISKNYRYQLPTSLSVGNAVNDYGIVQYSANIAPKNIKTTKVISNRFKSKDKWIATASIQEESIYARELEFPTYIYINIDINKLDRYTFDLTSAGERNSALGQWFKEHPTEIVYNLSKPIDTLIEDEQLISGLEKLEALYLNLGYNKITIQTINGVEANLDLTYFIASLGINDVETYVNMRMQDVSDELHDLTDELEEAFDQVYDNFQIYLPLTGGTLKGALNFENTTPITWNQGTIQQRIAIKDSEDKTDQTFSLQESNDSGNTFTNLMTISGEGTVTAKKFNGLATSATNAERIKINRSASEGNFPILLTNSGDGTTVKQDSIYASNNNTVTLNPAAGSIKANKFEGVSTSTDRVNCITIEENTDLNTITVPGFYRCSMSKTAGSLSNCPVSSAFFMIVGQSAYTYQELITYETSSSKRYMRNKSESDWGAWKKIYTEVDKPTLSDLGITATTTELNYVDGVTSNIQTQLNNKVDKVNGKGLSTNDYTTTEKNKLAGIEANANNYSLPQATSETLGGIKLGNTLALNEKGQVEIISDATAVSQYNLPIQVADEGEFEYPVLPDSTNYFPTSWTKQDDYTSYYDSETSTIKLLASSAASSTYPAADAMDGTVSTSAAWRSTGEINPWIKICFPNAVQIGSMKTYVRATSDSTFVQAVIQGSRTSNDTSDADWVTLYTITAPQSALTTINLNNPDYYFQYRIYFTLTATSAAAQVWEWQALTFEERILTSKYTYYLPDIPLIYQGNNKILKMQGVNVIDKEGRSYSSVTDPYLVIGDNEARPVIGTIRAGKYYTLLYDGVSWITEADTIGVSSDAIVFTTSGTYTIDPDLTYKVTLVGGGGGSALRYFYDNMAAGGAGGRINDTFVPTSDTITVTIGAAGSNYINKYDYGSGTNGGATKLGNFIAYGGGGATLFDNGYDRDATDGVGGSYSGGAGVKGADGIYTSTTSTYWANRTDNGVIINGVSYGGGGYIRHNGSDNPPDADDKKAPGQGVVVLYPIL